MCYSYIGLRLGVINTMWSVCSLIAVIMWLIHISLSLSLSFSLSFSLSHTHTYTLYCLSLSSLQSSSLRTKVEKYWVCAGRAAGKPTLLYKQTIMFINLECINFEQDTPSHRVRNYIPADCYTSDKKIDKSCIYNSVDDVI